MNCFEWFYILGKTIELFDFKYVKFVEILGFLIFFFFIYDWITRCFAIWVYEIFALGEFVDKYTVRAFPALSSNFCTI